MAGPDERHFSPLAPGRLRVLLVEEDPEATARRLERADDRIAVVTAAGASDGLDRLDEGPIDCVVGDHRPPAPDGVALLAAVRDERPDLPFVLFATDGSEDVAADAVAAGVTEYLQRDRGDNPYERLAERVRAAVDEARTRSRQRHLHGGVETGHERKLESLHAATRDLMAADAPDEVATVASEAANDILDIPMNGVHFHDADAGGLAPAVVSGPSSDLLGDPPTLGEDSIAWSAYRDGRALVHGDVRSVDERHNEDTPVRSEMHLPLGDHGVFILSATTPDAFDAADETLAKILAENVASALDRAAQARKLEALQEQTRSLMGTAAVNETASVAVDAAREILAAELSGFHRVSDDGQRLEPTAVTDTVPETFEAAPTYDQTADDPVASLVWEAFDGGEPTYLPDTAERTELQGRTPAGSAIVYPIDDRGVFIVSWREPAAYTETDAKLVDILASTLATALQRVERESLLRDRTTALERQNDRLERFADVVSHDLRNPLSVANGRLELARLECDSDHLDDVADALARMEPIIENTLELAQQGRTVDEPEHCSLTDLADDCWDHVATAEATLVVDDDLAVRGDPDRVRHVFENLFRNAVEHGGDGVTVCVGALDDGFYVADDGPGVPEGERDRVFERGYSSAKAGIGVGLAIVREICEAHDWSIRVAESDAGGARFEITGVERA
ncbi:GAF domain-containing protein [Halostella sp. JP-L12]|uniref:hybrid sensor histidine kinase/response regulator n=1 Tax=Halostella TaxID=1843185 RepID=UPI000EF7B6DD|nr:MULTISPECIES: GAF domain-containing sensor histidine kinase [Halostella]NHN46602.1 GAF domain-containing protein [Halostella sp. JP-L12]